MEYLKKYIAKYWKLFLTAVFFLTIEALCDVTQPTIMSKIVDIGIAGKQMAFIMKMGGLMLLITMTGAFGAVCRNILANRVSQRFGTELRSDLYRKIQYLSFENIDKFERASLVTRLTNDVTMVQNFTNGLMRIFVKAPMICLGSIIMAIHLNPRMSVVLFSVIPVIVIFIIINLKTGFPFFVRVQKALDSLNSVMREYLSGVRVVKAFNRFDYEEKRFETANLNQADSARAAMRVMSAFMPGITLTLNFGIIAVIWLGGINVSGGKMHVGQIIAFINYMTQMLFSLMMISMVFATFVRARASAGRIGEVFSENSTIKNIERPLKLVSEPGLKGRVDFENVEFTYSVSSGTPVIKNISFNILPGETVGIIGSTGSGKSSLVSLIPRFYDVSKGTVKVSGIDVKTADIKSLRCAIALVPQKTVLFTGTIMDNIKWGKIDASAEEIETAASYAQAHDFITSFPEGYDTVLGQGGVNLSGGQKQRIAIARALIRKPDILILDDCTSSVDVATEDKIKKALKKYSSGLTVIVIAQRITSVLRADKIIVMENGMITGMGKHGELMKSCSVYRDIFQSQIGKEIL